MSNQQHLDKWVEEECARIRRFAIWWRQQRAENKASDWPMNLPPGEWDDQYRMYDE